VRHLAALGGDQQVQPLGGGGLGVLLLGRFSQLFHVALVALLEPLLHPVGLGGVCLELAKNPTILGSSGYSR